MTNQEQLKDLKTEQVRSKIDIGIAAGLSKNYEYSPLKARELDKVINLDWWHSADFLTDLVKFGKVEEPVRLAVAFLLLTEKIPPNANSRTKSDLQVSCFAMLPSFDEHVAVEWADYRIRRAMEYLGRTERVIWSVDERNVPLQLALRDFGFKVILPNREDERLIFCR
jgi:hypothetical protein